MKDKFNLAAEERTMLGKQVKKLRREGRIPANVFGPKFSSKAIVVSGQEFSSIYKKAKETGVVYLKVGKEEIPTLIKNVQRHPVKHAVLHIDFRKIDLLEKIETEVPVKIIGESEAVAKGGVLLNQSDHLIVEALPTDIPEAIEVDISVLTEIDQAIKVADLPKNPKYEIKDDPEKLIASVIAHKEESLTPETTVTETEVITAKEGEEGVAAEGEEAPAKEPATEGKEKSEKAPEEKKE